MNESGVQCCTMSLLLAGACFALLMMVLAVADFAGDGFAGIFGANDNARNLLLRNRGEGFAEVGVDAGIAYNGDGRTGHGGHGKRIDGNRIVGSLARPIELRVGVSARGLEITVKAKGALTKRTRMPEATFAPAMLG